MWSSQTSQNIAVHADPLGLIQFSQIQVKGQKIKVAQWTYYILRQEKDSYLCFLYPTASLILEIIQKWKWIVLNTSFV